MQALTNDIIQFVHSRFPRRDISRVFKALCDAKIETPRVVRAVLYLSDGSMSMLIHYINIAVADVRSLLTWAEYIVDVGPEPMWARDMSLPFDHEQNLGAA